MKKLMLWLIVAVAVCAVFALSGCGKKEDAAGETSRQQKEKPTPPKETPQTKVVMTCGMDGHPQFEPGKQPADGKCPLCGMKLVRKEVPVEKTAAAYWTCPMHPEVKEAAPGNCPLCGMKLVEKKAPPAEE
jgi:DNA-directed RNA polymerase subunit RPC12/RpoP